MMNPNIPVDILNKIDLLFKSEFSRKEVQNIISSLWNRELNVGTDQLARSILVLSDGDLDHIKAISENLYNDPRDVIVQAEHKVGNPGHYFIFPFDTIEDKRGNL